MTFSMRSYTLVLTAVFLPLGPLAHAGTINVDSIVDDTYPDSGSRIAVVDGPDGPATVRLIEGGVAIGVQVRDAGTVIVEGGDITFTSIIEDGGKLVLLAGNVDCSDPICRGADIGALVTLKDSASLEVRGGFVGEFPIVLQEDATATFVGNDFTVAAAPSSTYFVQGTLLDGSTLNVRLEFAGEVSERLFFREVPEPSMTALTAIAAAIAGQVRGRRAIRPA